MQGIRIIIFTFLNYLIHYNPSRHSRPWNMKKRTLHHILMYNKIITYPSPPRIVPEKEKWFLRFHEVVYFQKIRPFISLWSHALRRKRILKLFSYPHTLTLICTNYFNFNTIYVQYSSMTCQTIYFLMITAKYTNRWQSTLKTTKTFLNLLYSSWQ